MKKIIVLTFVIAMIAGFSAINPAEALEDSNQVVNMVFDNDPDNDEDCCKESDEKEGECCEHDHKEGEKTKEAECNHSHEHTSKNHEQKENCESKTPCNKEKEAGEKKK
ncbi:MAG: hypothetical protein K9J21_12300 [Bacteroidales bacterium]|nr:hypothetical protein [Bacteroidales bacterium]